jgi:Protein of unknown function (DUF992)
LETPLDGAPNQQGKNLMPCTLSSLMSRRPRAVLVPLALSVLSALAAATPARAAHVEAGVLNCIVHGGAGFVFGSSKDLDCTFKGTNGGTEYYHGAITKYGLDLGFTSKSQIIWTVFAPSADVPAGALTGNYGGVSAEATVGLGVGANALVGGSNDSLALQPVSVQGQQGLNVAVGISQLQLRASH